MATIDLTLSDDDSPPPPAKRPKPSKPEASSKKAAASAPGAAGVLSAAALYLLHRHLKLFTSRGLVAAGLAKKKNAKAGRGSLLKGYTVGSLAPPGSVSSGNKAEIPGNLHELDLCRDRLLV